MPGFFVPPFQTILYPEGDIEILFQQSPSQFLASLCRYASLHHPDLDINKPGLFTDDDFQDDLLEQLNDFQDDLFEQLMAFLRQFTDAVTLIDDAEKKQERQALLVSATLACMLMYDKQSLLLLKFFIQSLEPAANYAETESLTPHS